MSTPVLKIGDWQELTLAKITNLYLYGQEDTPNNYFDRLRSKQDYDDLPLKRGVPAYVVELDADLFMSDGPGRYAVASEARAVADFFSGKLVLPEGRHSKQAIIALNPEKYKLIDFNLSFAHHDIDIGSPDYGIRTYIYNNAGFKLSDDLLFVVENGNLRIENLAILPLDDQFDFETRDDYSDIKEWLKYLAAKYGNENVLRKNIDPDLIGRPVEIEFNPLKKGPDSIPRTTYDIDDFNNDVAQFSLWKDGSLTDAKKPLEVIRTALNVAGIYNYDTDTQGKIVYGTAKHDKQLEGTSGGDVIVAGDGDDLVLGSIGNDTLFGGSHQDTSLKDIANYKLLEADLDISFAAPKIEGSNYNEGYIVKDEAGDFVDLLYGFEIIIGGKGNDTIKGSSGNDTLNGYSGDDVLYGGAGNDTLISSYSYGNLIVGVGADTLNGGENDIIKYIER